MTTHFILATAGHVDHGKSALVKALTGTDPDRLPEEKQRQITIDLGFAELSLAGSNEQCFQIGIVDVPGHEDFVRNMIAGVGSIDLALLIVAADDGWMQQTEEHLQILTYLGVERAVVALTKSDLGGVEAVTRQIRDCLRHSPFANAQIIATSVRNGDGIETLKRALAIEFATMYPPRDYGKPRLFTVRNRHRCYGNIDGRTTAPRSENCCPTRQPPHAHSLNSESRARFGGRRTGNPNSD